MIAALNDKLFTIIRQTGEVRLELVYPDFMKLHNLLLSYRIGRFPMFTRRQNDERPIS